MITSRSGPANRSASCSASRMCSLIWGNRISSRGTPAQVACDGVLLGAMEPDVDVLDIEAAKERITLLHPPGYDYYRLLRSKLHWGRGAYGQHNGLDHDQEPVS